MTLRDAAAVAAAVMSPTVPTGEGDVSARAMALLSPAAAARTPRKFFLDPRSFTSPGMTAQFVGRLLSVAVHSAARSAGADAADAVTTAMSVAGVGRAQVYRNVNTAETVQRAGVNPGEALKSRQGLHDKTRSAKRVMREHWKTPLSRENTNTNTNTKYTCDTGQTRNKLLAQWVHLTNHAARARRRAAVPYA